MGYKVSNPILDQVMSQIGNPDSYGIIPTMPKFIY